MFLSTYVEDFKLSGSEKNIGNGWELIRSRLDIGSNTPAALYWVQS